MEACVDLGTFCLSLTLCLYRSLRITHYSTNSFSFLCLQLLSLYHLGALSFYLNFTDDDDRMTTKMFDSFSISITSVASTVNILTVSTSDYHKPTFRGQYFKILITSSSCPQSSGCGHTTPLCRQSLFYT